METKIVAGHKVTTFRKYNTKLVLSMRDKAIELLSLNKSLEEIYPEIVLILKDYKRPTNTYVSFSPKCEWNERESLSIRDRSYDCTYVSIYPGQEKETDHCVNYKKTIET